ncbi:MAG: CD1871A family CXXC motif-containing protein [Eubacteriales bacterium]
MKPKADLTKILLTSAGPLLCIIGAAAVIFGYYRGEAAMVLSKAIMVCMECIGIG